MYFITISLGGMPFLTMLKPYKDYLEACKDAQFYCDIDKDYLSFSIINPLSTIIIN